MATAPPPVKPILTAPPTIAPDKHGQFPVQFDALMQSTMTWLNEKWYGDATATITYMQSVLSLAQGVSADVGAAVQAKQDAETARGQAQTAASSANTSMLAAGGSAGQASTSATNANTAAVLAQDWASKLGSPVSGGLYSSRYYCELAYTYAQQAAGGGEPSIPVSTTDKWYRGDKTWQVLPVATISAAGMMSAADKLKLNNVADYASSNFSNAYLLDRANHSGSQEMTTVNGLTVALAGKQSTLTSGTTIKTVGGAGLLGSGNLRDLANLRITDLQGVYVTVPANNVIDLSLGDRFAETINGNETYTIINPPAAGFFKIITLRLTVNSGTPTFWSGAVWDGGSPPPLTVGGVAEIVMCIDPGGARTAIFVPGKDMR